MPGFADGDLGLLLDCVAACNAYAGQTICPVRLISEQGTAVPAASGRDYGVDCALIQEGGQGALLWVLAGAVEADIDQQSPLNIALARCHHGDRMVAASFGGAFYLARAGLLDGVRASVHWTLHDLFADRFPNVIASPSLYEIESPYATCGGGLSTAELFIHLMATRFGNELAASLSDRLLLERVRTGDVRQRVPLQAQLGASQPKLTQAVSLMEANLEEPLTTDEVASLVGISRRQLERLFKQHLDRVPSQYYLELRLNRARQLLKQTAKSIIQIGLSCGFSSGPHFSSAYRNHFGMTPREDRQSVRRAPGG
ncbi:GlxA family transcriptional regulator [Burkholderiaceae bacterium DAT-1]|nr:GlxA family transcriptional regulator [Burkholderiaceae bacterium DAT-1]